MIKQRCLPQYDSLKVHDLLQVKVNNTIGICIVYRTAAVYRGCDLLQVKDNHVSMVVKTKSPTW